MSTQTINQRRLRKGVEVTVPGQGRYRIIRVRDLDFDCWGPIDSGGNCPRGRVRSFYLDDIAIVHRKERGR